MDDVQEMMESLAINESSLYDYEYVDLKYEFDACQFFDFSVNETDYEVHEAERWFGYAREYPPAPYIMKIKLHDVSNSAPAKLPSTITPKPEGDEYVSASIVTPSNWSMASQEEKTKVNSGLKNHNLFADDDDDHIMKVKPKSTSKLSKQNRRFMKPTVSHLSKQINSVDLQTYTGCVTDETKRQKLEIGFLRKVNFSWTILLLKSYL
ncbi:hypothetical protein LXL04_021701 [Taraxacum kok-saghyz]